MDLHWKQFNLMRLQGPGSQKSPLFAENISENQESLLAKSGAFSALRLAQPWEGTDVQTQKEECYSAFLVSLLPLLQWYGFRETAKFRRCERQSATGFCHAASALE